jgi:septal ring factor EnvC (AmiA/AmiB activator)
MRGRQTLESELKKLDSGDEESKNRNKPDEKKQQEDQKNEKTLHGDEMKEREKVKAQTKKWLEKELTSIREAIRVRREVAVVRGAVEANRIMEGQSMYGDETEPGVEKMILKPVATSPMGGLPSP